MLGCRRSMAPHRDLAAALPGRDARRGSWSPPGGWRLWGTLLAGAVGLTLAVGVHSVMRAREDETIRAEFARDAETRIRAVEVQFATDLEVLHALRAFYRGSIHVDREEFGLFTAYALKRHEGSVRALEYAVMVSASGRIAHEEQQRADGLEGYEIRESSQDGEPTRAGDRERYCPVVYVTPPEASAGIVGLDLAAEESRRATLEEARDTGELRATPDIRLLHERVRGDVGILAIAAIYSNALPATTVEERRAALVGYVVAAFVITDAVERALAHFPRGLVQVRVEDRSALAGSRILYGDEADPDSPSFGLKRSVPVGGRELLLACSPGPNYVASRRSAAPFALGASLAFATLVGVGYLILLTRRAERVERLVADRTATIREVSRLKQAILDSASYSIISTDPKGVIRTFNAAARQMLGYAEEEIIGKATPVTFHDPGELARRAARLGDELGRPVRAGFEVFAALAARGGEDLQEWTYVRKDGTRFPVLLSLTAMRGEQEEITGYLGVADDITERKAAERELVAAKAAAETASRTKSQFLANMSHELRTPLTAIIGYSEMLEEEASEAALPRFVQDLKKVHSAGRHLLQLINDVLDLSKVEAGRVELCFEATTAEQLVRDAVATVAPLAARNGNTLDVRCPEETVPMETDVTRVGQVLLNVLSNAAKFTDKGRIEVEAEADGASHVRIKVRDTGIGIPPAKLARIFEPFAQADGSTTRRYGGTGLGLAICREYCTLLAGSIEVKSTPGKGSTFTIRLPRRPRRSPPAADRDDGEAP